MWLSLKNSFNLFSGINNQIKSNLNLLQFVSKINKQIKKITQFLICTISKKDPLSLFLSRTYAMVKRIGMPKSSTGLKSHGAPSQMEKILNNFLAMVKRIGMPKFLTGLKSHGAPSQMEKNLNNFLGMGWRVEEK